MNENTQAPALPEELVFGEGGIKEVAYQHKLVLLSEFNPILRKPLPEYDFASETNEERKAFTDALVGGMRSLYGLGLSANQVGIEKRVFVMDTLDSNADRDECLVCFNPKVVIVGEIMAAKREGCLTFPALTLQIKRATAIGVEYQDWEGNKHTKDLFDINARCFLHELDHMNGVLFTSKVSNGLLGLEKQKAAKRIKKHMKAFARD